MKKFILVIVLFLLITFWGIALGISKSAEGSLVYRGRFYDLWSCDNGSYEIYKLSMYKTFRFTTFYTVVRTYSVPFSNKPFRIRELHLRLSYRVIKSGILPALQELAPCSGNQQYPLSSSYGYP